MTTCAHRTLRFGSGGYYIFCSETGCNASWIAWKMGEDERVPGVSKGQPICGSSTMGARFSIDPRETGIVCNHDLLFFVNGTCFVCTSMNVEKAIEREACAKLSDELMDAATGASREAFRIIADRIRKRSP